MKIAVFAQNMFPPWIEGIKNNSLFLCSELTKYLDLVVISHKKPGAPINSQLNGFPVVHLLRVYENRLLQCIEFFLGGLRCLFFLIQEKISIVSFQYLEISFILPMFFVAIFRPKTSFILTLYSSDELRHWYKRWTLFLLKSKFKKIVIISEYLREEVRNFGFLDEDIVYIPLSFDKERYLRASDFEKRDKNLLLFSAGPIEEAGSFLLVDVAKKMPEFRFIFAMRQFNKRSEMEMALLEEYIDAHGVKNIEILRNIDNMEELLSKVGALVLPLQTIDIKMLIPVALLEAMARGTICFVSNLPNLQALVTDGQDAVIFDRTNADDLVSKIRKYSNKLSISAGAYEFAQQFPSYKEIAEEYVHLIQKTAGSI